MSRTIFTSNIVGGIMHSSPKHFEGKQYENETTKTIFFTKITLKLVTHDKKTNLHEKIRILKL